MFVRQPINRKGSTVLSQEPIISVSGLRGIIGQTLTPEIAARYALAFSSELPPGPLALTRDGRASGHMIADALRASLCAVGRDVIDADVAATPTTGILVRHLGAVGGIQISASHNPSEYNGLKLFNREGRVISDADGQPVLERYRKTETPDWRPHNELGTVTACTDTLQQHLKRVLCTVNANRIQARRYRVLLDSNHGAGSLLGELVLKQLGCDVTLLGTPADGQFEHTPEPTADNLDSICEAVRSGQFDVGFCQDPDADRLAIIDETGRYIGEEFTLAIAVRHALQQAPGPIVTNCSTSRMSEDLANLAGVPFFRTKVGEANVTARMIEVDAAFGGEGNGGPIDPKVVYVRDSFVGMARTLDALSASQQSISQHVATLPQYAIYKTKVAVDPSQIANFLDRLETHFADATADRMDGLRLDWPGQWLLVRASNTEPIVRLIAESQNLARARRLCEQAAAL